MGKRRAVTFVIGCHCFVYFFVYYNLSWRKPLPDHHTDNNTTIALNNITRGNDSIASYSLQEPSYRNPHPYSFVINQPDLCSASKNESVVAVVLVCSAVRNFQERQVIRETWGSTAYKSGGPVRLGFLVGLTADSSLQERVETEAEEHGDVIQEDFLDTYLNLTLKSVMLLKWVKEYCRNVQYVLKTDDDMYINIPNFLKTASKLKHRENVMFGVLHQGFTADRNPNDKWYIPKSQFPEPVLPDYLSGTSYAMTADVVSKLFNASLDVPFLQLEDIFVTGVCASKAGVRRENSGAFSGYAERPATGCAFKDAVSGHHVNNSDKRKIWSELNSKDLKCDSG